MKYTLKPVLKPGGQSNTERQYMYQFLTFLALAMIVFDILKGNQPIYSFGLYALSFNSWQNERVSKRPESEAKRINHRVNSWTLQLVLVVCVGGYIASQIMNLPAVSISNLTLYGGSTVLIIKAMGRIYALQENT